MTLTAAQLRTYYAAAGLQPPTMLLPDVQYMCPTAAWLEGPFYDWFRAALQAFGLEQWSAENWDCDDFADLYAVLAKIAHKRTKGSDGSGLAVGPLYFLQKRGGGHAINVSNTPDRGVVTPEPQTGKMLILDPAEIRSAWFLKQ